MPVAPSGLVTLERVSQGKPWAKFPWPVGPKIDSTHIEALPNVQTAVAGAKCLGQRHPKNRPKGGMICAGVYTDSMIGVTKFHMQKLE
jgi:hypothetical protein